MADLYHQMTIKQDIEFSLIDRWRIFFGFPLTVETIVYHEKPIGVCQIETNTETATLFGADLKLSTEK